MAQQRPIAIELDGEAEPSDPLGRAEHALVQRLEREGRVLSVELAEARARQETVGGRLSTALWELGLVDEIRLRTLGADVFGVPPALPGDVANAPEEVTALLDRDFVTTYRVAPFARNREVLLVATAEPWRLPLLDSIGSRLGCRVEPRFLDEAPLGRLLGELYGLPVDDRFTAEPRKRQATAPVANPSGGAPEEESSVFGSSDQLMSETSFDAIYQSGDGADRAAVPPTAAVPAPPRPVRPAAATAEAAAPPQADPAPSPASQLLDGLESWDPRYDTRRAAPLGLEESQAALTTAADVSQLGWVLARHALTLGRRVVLLLHRSDVWMGWTGAGDGIDPAKIAALMVPAQAGTFFGAVASERTPWSGRLERHPIQDRFVQVLGSGEPPRTAALVPISIGPRIGLGIYLDGGPGGALPESLWSIAKLAAEVPAALERLASRAAR
ncbi:MAG: hypothetical protein OEP95_15835 [Myxococcales bacterium]|nr:hypothetical protein [Myxococcales bacterium]